MRSYETNEFYFNKDFAPKTLNNMRPLYYSIPVVAYRVSYVENRNPENIIEQTIFKLKKIGYSNSRIAYTLCLDPRVVGSVLEYYDANETEEGEQEFPKEKKIGYILYDCYGERFFDGYIPENVFKENTDLYLVERYQHSFTIKKAIAESNEYRVRVLIKSDCSRAPLTPTTEMMLGVRGAEGRKIDSDFYIHAEYLNERIELNLISAIYADNNDCSAISVSAPLKCNSPRLRMLLEQILAAYPNENVRLAEGIEKMRRNMAEAISDVTSEKWTKAHEDAVNKVSANYGEAIRQFREVFAKAVEVEEANEKLNAAKDDLMSPEYMQACNLVKTTAHHLMEQVLMESFFKHFDSETMLEYGKISKNTAGRELLRAYILDTGFKIEDKQLYYFINGVNVNNLRYVFNSSSPPQEKRGNPRINLWFVANVMLGRVQKSHPIHKLAVHFPETITSLGTTLRWRNDAAHDSKPEFFSRDDAQALMAFCERVLRIMLGIEYTRNADTVKNQAATAKAPSMQSLIKHCMRNISTQNDEILDKTEKLCSAFFMRDSTYYLSVSNYLHAICRGYLERLYDETTRTEIVNDFPENRDEGKLLINKILQINDIKYTVISVVGKEKLKVKNNNSNLEYDTLTAILYLLISFIDKKRPLMFKNIPHFKELVAVTDEATRNRGHSEGADFEADGEQLEKKFNELLKFAEEYKE